MPINPAIRQRTPILRTTCNCRLQTYGYTQAHDKRLPPKRKRRCGTLNHTMAQMLAMICNEHQNDWDAHIPRVEYAYNNSVSAATGLAPNEVHIGRLPHLPLTVFDRSYGGGHQSLDRDHLAYSDLARERQQHAYELVREQHALTVARVKGRNSTLSDALLCRPKYVAGGWVWVYNTAATIRQGLHKGVDNKVLKEKLPLNWTGPFKIIAVGPSPAATQPDERPLGDKLLYFALPSNLSGPAAKPRVTVTRCKPCANPYDEGFNDWGWRGYDDFVPEEVAKTAPSGDEIT